MFMVSGESQPITSNKLPHLHGTVSLADLVAATNCVALLVRWHIQEGEVLF